MIIIIIDFFFNRIEFNRVNFYLFILYIKHFSNAFYFYYRFNEENYYMPEIFQVFVVGLTPKQNINFFLRLK